MLSDSDECKRDHAKDEMSITVFSGNVVSKAKISQNKRSQGEDEMFRTNV